MNLPLDLRTTGRAKKPLTAEVARQLDEADLLLLAEEKGSRAPAIKRISDRHHNLARHIASGVKPGEAALICRYDASRVSILLSDPAFQELLAFYRSEAQAEFVDFHSQLAGVGRTALDEIACRLEDAPEDISLGQLMEITKLGADRTGHGPQTSTTNLNVNVDLASKLEAARRRVADRTLPAAEAVIDAD